MFDGIKNGGAVFGAAAKATIKYPLLLVPLVSVWAIYAPLTIYLQYYFDWDKAPGMIGFGVAFGTLFFISTLLSWSCFLLLEQIRRIETGENTAFLPPIIVASKNVLRALPITLAWAVLWFLITLVEMMFRKTDSSEDEKQATPENIARTLGGDGGFSISGAFFRALKKGVRMIAFLIFPAIAWEKEDKPIKRGLAVARAHKAEFATGFALTEVATMIIFIPPAIVFAIADNTDVVISDDVWMSVIIYCGFAWSLSMLLEQLFTAELYLWDIKWREACETAEANNQTLPKLADIPRPSILDDRPDMLPA